MRTATLLLLLVPPFVAAAPVPKRPPDFTHSCPPELLATLPFVDARPGPMDRDEAQPVAVAVHLSRTKYTVGDPADGLFVVRNRSAEPIGLRSELVFTARHTRVIGGCGITVRDRNSGETVGPFATSVTNCGGALGTIPANGYYAVRGDVATASDGKPLPVGDYELGWRFGGTQSNTVKFSVVSRRLGQPEPIPVKPLAFFRLTLDGDAEATEWLKPQLEAYSGHDLSRALSTGVYGAYHPCVRDLPAMTGGLKVSAALNGDGLSITVDSPNREFDRVEWRHPTIYLMFEHAGNNEDARATENEQAADRKSSPSDFPKLPVKLRLKLPPKWREATEMTGACRVSVIVASRVPPQRPGGVKIVESRAEKTVGATRVTTKSGEWVLRTDWLALPDIYK